MDNIKSLINQMFLRYCIVFTLIVGVNIVGRLVLQEEVQALSISELLYIEVMAILCALGEVFSYTKKELSKRQVMIRKIAHYIYINVIVFGTIGMTGKIEVGDFVVILLVIAFIYWINFITDFHEERKETQKMNEKLRNYNNYDE